MCPRLWSSRATSRASSPGSLAQRSAEEFGFGVMPELDLVASDDERRKRVLELCKRALTRLETFGDPIAHDTLNALRAGRPGEGFPRDLEAKILVEPARAFIDLLED
jgi:hypothetical protein